MNIDRPILNEAYVEPTLDHLSLVLGANITNYKRLLEIFDQNAMTPVWAYYKDGKSWLFKVQWKKKTVLWMSVWEHCFKLSFFFAEKTRDGIEDQPIDPQIKSAFKQQTSVGKLIPLLVEVYPDTELSDIKALISYKINVL